MIVLWCGTAYAIAPDINILSPTDGDSYAYGDYITFLMSGSNPDDLSSELSLQWISTKNGILTLTNNTYNNLERGTHTITLIATDTENEISTKSITLYIRGEPTASITSPANNSELQKGVAVIFSGTGTDNLTLYDDDNTTNSVSYKWTLDSTTLLSESDEFTALGPNPNSNDYITLDYGVHTINFTVTDSDGDTDTASIEVEVLNTIPTAVISAPITGSSYHYGNEVILDGSTSYDGLESVEDEDDNQIPDSGFVWTSSIDGDLEKSDRIVLTDLSIGTHTIKLSVTDSQGSTGTDTISITITQDPPVAQIDSPAADSIFLDGAEILFIGEGIDPDDEIIAYEWESSIDGIISTERTFTTTTLTEGYHTITLTVTDSYGETGTTSINISTTNTVPTATILTPSNGSRFTFGETVTFRGEGHTYLDENIIGSDLVWSSVFHDAVTNIGTGDIISVSDLVSGTHTIQLTATDTSNSKSITDTILISIGLRVQDAAGTDINALLIQDGLETITVSGGVPPYSVFATSPVNAALTGITSDSATITVSGTRSGTGTVTISDDEGTDATISVVIGSETGGIPPVADAGDNQTVLEGSTVILDGTGSSDADDAVVSYMWKGDYPLIFSSATSPQTTFVAFPVNEEVKILNINLTVTDENNNQDTDEMILTILDNGITRYPYDVTSFFSATQKEMGIKVKSGGNLTQLSVVDPNTVTDTVNMPQNMIYGLIDFSVRLYNQVNTIIVGVYLPEPAAPGYRWYKYSQASGWLDFSRDVISDGKGDGAVFNDERTIVYLYLTDNQAYDDSGNTLFINDPSGLGIIPSASEEDDSDDGCFINSL